MELHHFPKMLIAYVFCAQFHTYSYDAFGNLISSTGSTANNYRYCGEQFDSTTELYYLRARYMDTSTGRFISQDSYAGSIDDPTSLHKKLLNNNLNII